MTARKNQPITLIHIFPHNRYFFQSDLVHYILRRNEGEILARSVMHYQFPFKIAVIVIIGTWYRLNVFWFLQKWVEDHFVPASVGYGWRMEFVWTQFLFLFCSLIKSLILVFIWLFTSLLFSRFGLVLCIVSGCFILSLIQQSQPENLKEITWRSITNSFSYFFELIWCGGLIWCVRTAWCCGLICMWWDDILGVVWQSGCGETIWCGGINGGVRWSGVVGWPVYGGMIIWVWWFGCDGVCL